jgi:DNA-binding NarL/FixJ family response regulator
MMGHTLLIAHHQAALRRTLRMLLGFLPGVDTVHEVADSAQVVPHVARVVPDVVLLGLAQPPDLTPVRQLRAVGFRGRVVVLTTSDALVLYFEALSSGADCVLCTAVPAEGWMGTLRQELCGSTHDAPHHGAAREPGMTRRAPAHEHGRS